MARSYIKEQLVWYPRNNISNPQICEYIVSYSDNETLEPVNNKATVRLYDYDKVLVRNGVFLPQQGEIMNYYSKEVTSADDTSFTESDIIWSGIFMDKSYSESIDDDSITLTLMDLGYQLFNRFWARTYNGLGKKTNEIITDIVQNGCEALDGSGTYTINTDNIATLRNNGSPFPVIEPVFVNKPVHEWLSELSQKTWTNSDAELSSTPVIKIPMIFKILGTKAYWFEQPTTESYTISNNTYILDMSDNTENQEEVNYLIIECGEDFNGKPIYAYLENDQSKSSFTKERYEKVPKIAGLNQEYDNGVHVLRSQYTVSTNSEFRDKVREYAKSHSDYWFYEFGKGRPSINVSLPYNKDLEVGSIIYVTRRGYDQGYYRVMSKTNNTTINSRTTTLQLEKVLQL